MRNPSIVILLFLAFLGFGCSGRGLGNAVQPSPQPPQSADGGRSATEGDSTSNRFIWGLWVVSVSADHQSMDVVPWRAPAMHLNVLSFLEMAPCQDCLKIQSVKLQDPNTLTADLLLRHPIPDNPRFCGFDVRGVFITAGDYTFPIGDRLMAWGDGVPRLLNADGYTSLFNPTEYPSSSALPPELKYTPGKYSHGGDLTATLNPFMAYDIYYPGRRAFWPSTTPSTEHVTLHIPDGAFKFGYAVDASWMKVEGEIDSVDDFPVEANCPEAYQITVKQWNTLQPSLGSSSPVYVEISDHQGLGTIKSATMEAPDVFYGQIGFTYVETIHHGYDEDTYLYSATISNAKQVPEGSYPMLVTVTDTKDDVNLGPVKAYQVFPVHVTNGWLATWGAPIGSYNWLMRSAIDNYGSIYVCGLNTGDKDPSPNVVKGGSAYISKLNDKGKLIWSRSWEGSDYRFIIQSVYPDQYGALYATGQFKSSADFDPGEGGDVRQASGVSDIFLMKLDSFGNYKWTRTWGSNYYSSYDTNPGECGMDVATDPLGNIYVAGIFEGKADFDPGPDVFELEPVGGPGAFLSKFSSSGDFQWAVSWGGGKSSDGMKEWADGAYGLKIFPPDSIYVFGHYSTLTDFDPGPGVVERDGDDYDCFLVKFKDSEFQWVGTWEASWISRIGCQFDVDGYGDTYLTGLFNYGEDIDPTDGVFAPWGMGGYVTKLDSDGGLQWISLFEMLSAGPLGNCFPLNVVADESDSVTVSGTYAGTIDFDPSDAVDLHENNKEGNWTYGFHGAGFVCQLSREGAFHWADSFGDNDECIDSTCSGLVVDKSGNVYAAGVFTNLGDVGTDFDPGPLTEYRLNSADGDQYLMMFPPDGNW
jgi:hypothetical protein